MNVDYNTETQEITVELNAPKIEMNTPTGGRGLKGDKGNKGDTGTAATITVGSTTTGSAGTSASVTNTGTSSAAVLNFTIPKGDKGDTGPAGPSQWGVITGSLSNQTDLKNALDNKVDVSSLSTVATSGDYTDLSNTPTIPDKLADLTDDSTHRVVTDTEKTTWSGKQDALVSGSNIKTINNTSILGSGDITIAGASAWGDLTGDINDQTDLKNALDNKVDSSSLSTVATSGDYDDLDNKPTIPTNVSDLNNDSGFISSETDPIYSASAASGITSTDITNWNGKSNFSGSYNDLTDKPTIPTKTSNLNNDSGFITNTVNNLTNYELKTDTGHSIELSLNTTTYVMTLNLKNSAGTTISTDTIDFPLESVVVNGSYDSANKKIILTLESGSTIEIPVADLISGLQSEITSSNMLSSDLVDDTGHTNKFVTSSEKTTWSGKQDALVSGTNIKTINNTSLLGSGNISIGGGGTATDVKINGTSITAGGEADILTETAYDSSTNKIATMSDVPDTSSFIDKDVNNLTNYSLTTTLQTNKNLTKGVEYIVGTQSSDTNAWKGTSTDTGCSSGTLYTGKMIMYHLPTAGTSSAATLNLTLPDGTTTGAKNIYRQASTTVTTTFAAGCDIFMVYDGTQWKINAYVDTTNSNTIGYQLRTNSAIWTNKTGYASNRYTLLFEVDGGLSGAATSIGTGTSKTTVAFKYIPNGVIKYYSTNGSIANNSNFTATGLWDQYAVNLSYTFNTGSTLTSGKPVYMRCTVNSDGTLSPNYSGSPSHPIVQALPSTADGKVYVYLGQAYSTTNMELYMRHPIFEYKNGKIREYVPAIAYSEISGTPTIPTNVSDLNNDAGYITSYTETDPVFSASAAAGITSSDITNWNNKSDFSGSYTDLTNTPTIPTNVSDLNNDSGFIDGYETIDIDDIYAMASTSDATYIKLNDLINNDKPFKISKTTISSTSSTTHIYDATDITKSTSSNGTYIYIRYIDEELISNCISIRINGTSITVSGFLTKYIAEKSYVSNYTGMTSDTWSSSSTYKKGQIVNNDGKLYRNKTGTTGTYPSIDTTNWENITLYDAIYDTGWVDLTASTGTWTYLRYRVVGKTVYVEGYASSLKYSGSSTTIVSEENGLPSAYRPTGSSKYSYGHCASGRIARFVLGTGGNIVLDWTRNLTDGNTYTTAIWHSFNISYMID